MNHGLTLESLKAEFLREFPNTDYFTQQKVFKYMDMAYTMGMDGGKIRNAEKKVVRSDNEEYKSISLAARENFISREQIWYAIKNNKKRAGYFWKYA